jgi:spermidine/putrescine transport system permease protein
VSTGAVSTGPASTGPVSGGTLVAGVETSKRRRRAPGWALAAPAWFWYLGFFVVPVFFVLAYSFGSKPANAGDAGLVDFSNPTTDNYTKVFEGDGPFFSTLKQTLRIAGLGTLMCFLIGFPLAYFIAIKVRPKYKALMLALVIVPFWTSFLLRTIAWRIVLSPKGLTSNFLRNIGVIGEPFRYLDTRTGVQIGVVYNYLPLMIFPLFVALDRLDPTLREASKDLGAGRLRTFMQTTVPLAMPGIIAGLILVYVPLAGDYVTANLLGGAKGNMIGTLIASQFKEGQNAPLGAATAVSMIVMILLSVGFVALIGYLVSRILRTRRTVAL